MDVKVEKALNEQIHAEFFSFYLYLSVSAYFSAEHLDGFAHWMKIQAQEELLHAMKLFDYVNERSGSVRLAALEAPQREWASPSVAVEAVLNHERHISARINELVNLANTVKDHATTVVLHWYVNEQVEEEATADTLFHQVRMLEGSPHGLLMLDRELAGRTLSAPPPAE
ncbi:MAG TPA: ferritin [Thermoanaerobaculales bacterium]|nr:ferritin [Thermoanaerobaculales bacterium]HPA82528.1 ferritin [Thermoanaerobaculales bacterium]HQL28786.1 ferritin [Thermoanaerobaculales bacterium]HQN96104.1 ferritin [Thermoanaerobaculales bacterium]HQP42658.1 ferritin [Thermoanaerobaculales bacterium]